MTWDSQAAQSAWTAQVERERALAARLAQWAQTEGIATGGVAAEVAETLSESPVMEPGTAAAPSPQRPRLPRLAYAERGWTSAGVYEPVKGATATEGGELEWLFERAEDGTWSTSHLPTKTVVKAGLRTLPACRGYVASGKARKDFERIQAEGKENVNG